MLSAESIKENLLPEYSSVPVIVYDSTDSTNTRAKISDIRCGIIAANEQTAGKGRHGKSFFSPKDTGLYMSVIIPVSPMHAFEFSLTAAAAVAAARAIEKLCGVSVGIKWVNDLYYRGKKVCGILTEADRDRVIVGIGINLSTVSFPESAPLAGSLGVNVSISRLAAEIANELFPLAMSDSLSFMDEYCSRSILLGKTITFEKDGISYTAQALRIEKNGNLTVQCNGSLMTLAGGEVHIVM